MTWLCQRVAGDGIFFTGLMQEDNMGYLRKGKNDINKVLATILGLSDWKLG